MTTQVVTIAEPAADIAVAEHVVSVDSVERVAVVSVDGEDVTISVTDQPVSVTIDAGTVAVAVTEPAVTVTESVSGPQGPPGESAEDAMPYSERVDMVGDTVIYRGFAALPTIDGDPAPSESASAWRIKRLTIAGNDIVTQWADGNALFDNAWTDRLTLDYS